MARRSNKCRALARPLAVRFRREDDIETTIVKFNRRSQRFFQFLALLVTLIAVPLVIVTFYPASSIWSEPKSLEINSSGLQALACTSGSCMTFDFAGRTFVGGPFHWHIGPQVFSGRNFEVPISISCATSIFCVIGGDNGDVAMISGLNVKYIHLGPQIGSINSISCPTSRFCIAATENGGTWKWNGSQWHAINALPSAMPSATVVSCTSEHFCAFGGLSGGAAILDGHNLSSFEVPQTAGTGDEIFQMSCASKHFCMAISLFGRYFIFNGVTWHDFSSFEGPQNQGYSETMLACPSNGRCVASSTRGVIDVFAYHRWFTSGYLVRQSVLSRVATELFPTFGAPAVACASATMCVAVDAGGNSYIGHPFK